MKKITLVTSLVVALCAAPAMAERPADRPDKKDRSGKREKAGSKSKRCKVVMKAFVLKGTPSADGSSVVNVTKANRHARNWLGTATTYDLATALGKDGAAVTPKFKGVVDGPDEGTDVGMSDVLATDRVKVKGKVGVAKKGGKKKACASGGGSTATAGAVVIKSIRISRKAPEPAPAPAPTA